MVYDGAMTGPSSSDRLDSWKEIAAYLRRSVRTVRRWEAREGLPIHRQMHRSLASVYAFRSEIDAWQEARKPSPTKGSSPVRAVVTELLETERESIAVLPFAYLGPEPEKGYIADGFTEEVIAALSKLRAVRVISRTSSMALKGTSKSARTIGRELTVQHLLEGSVRQDGSRIRISVRLIDPATDDRVWAETYEGTIEDVFAIQEQIARRIVTALELHLTPDEDRGLSDRSADNVIAWQCALQARQEALRWRGDSIDRAIQILLNGVAVVGHHADLYAALSWAHLQYREAAVDLGEAPLEKAENYARKLFELDAQSSIGRQLRGWIRYSRGQVQDAVRDLQAALESDWNQPDTLALLSNCYLISGRVSHARPFIDRLLAIDPLTPLNRCMPGWAHASEGNFAAAVGPYREMFEMDPGNPMARLFYTWILAANGKAREVRALVEGFPPELEASPPAQIAALFASALTDRSPKARIELSPWTEQLAETTDVFPRILGQACALAGDRERAVHWISIAVDRGFINYPFLAEHDPFLRKLARHPPYIELLELVRRRWQAFEP